nr:hypothetical protein [Rhizobium leguminosarum]
MFASGPLGSSSGGCVVPKFYFQLFDRDGVGATETGYDFDSIEAAKAEARRVLAEMAAEGLPTAPLNMMSVELFDESRRPLAEIRLILEEIAK